MAVVTTMPDVLASERLATTLVEERLAACANIVPSVTSIYRWKGSVQKDDEVLVVFKTTESAVAGLRDRIVELHPYDVPEVVVLRVVDGSEEYLRWVCAEVRAAS